MSSSGIPLDSNFKSLSCQLGGLTLNGNVTQETAQSYNIITINDPAVVKTLSKSSTGKYLQVNLGNELFYIPLFQ